MNDLNVSHFSLYFFTIIKHKGTVLESAHKPGGQERNGHAEVMGCESKGFWRGKSELEKYEVQIADYSVVADQEALCPLCLKELSTKL